MKQFARIFAAIFSIFILGATIWGIINYRQVLDFFALQGYEPPARISELATVTTMNDKTRRVFYVNQPLIQPKVEFKNSCTREEETIVLGCFVENDGIYLLEVTDPRLSGIIEVTAAHEVLHAMYDRLSEEERVEIDRQSTAFFETLQNPRIRKNVENYRAKDPSIVANELHSILGTEVRNLTPELEQYYSRYFNDRQAIVAFSEKYEQTFVDLENQVEQLKNQLEQLKKQLDQGEAELESLGGQIDEQRSRLDSLLGSGRVDEYNAGVASFNGLVNRYNDLIQQRKSKIARYNELVTQYNEVATQEAELVDSLKGVPQEVQGTVPN